MPNTFDWVRFTRRWITQIQKRAGLAPKIASIPRAHDGPLGRRPPMPLSDDEVVRMR